MESLIKIIENYYDRKIISEELSSDEQEELEYLKSFIKSFNINDIRSILGFDQMKYFICCIAYASVMNVLVRVFIDLQVFGMQNAGIRKAERSLDDVFEFADVARPAVVP